MYDAKSEAINMNGICALFGARAVGYQFSVSNWVSEFQDKWSVRVSVCYAIFGFVITHSSGNLIL